jgi:hypothetical protein
MDHAYLADELQHDCTHDGALSDFFFKKTWKKGDT